MSTRLIPVTKWNDYHPWPGQGGLRHLIFHAERNGFAKAFKRVGRRVLIDEEAFFKCINEKNLEAFIGQGADNVDQGRSRAVQGN
jgi:hypothetical protein